MKKAAFILLPLFFVILSCSKERGDSCEINKNTVAGRYKATKAWYKASKNIAGFDFYSTLYPEACNQDDIFDLKLDGTYAMEDAGTQCSPVNENDGTWSIIDDKLVTDGLMGRIAEFDCNKTMVLSFEDFYNDGDELTVTYTRQ